MSQSDHGTTDPFDAARARYQAERAKRLRSDGLLQFQELTGEFAEFDRDPFADPTFDRDPITESVDVVVVGAGFAGMLTSVQLLERGVTSFRIIDKAGDFGGTWYWNRYPGCMCDVESYTYLPLLEATGYMPTMKYAGAPEIFAHCQRIGTHFGLYEHALFQTEVDTAEWDDATARWMVVTSRGDRLSTRFLVTAGGILSKAKLPGIPGIETFAGKAFHTSRWDYTYTGGGPTEPMDELADKRVGIIGTGATAVQVVPQLAKSAKEVYVFQRTPSAVGIRDNGPTDESWFRSLAPGWQSERIRNFTQAVTGKKPAVNMVRDGWTEVMWEDTQSAAATPEEQDALERSDFATMEAIRQRVLDTVDDAETAQKLLPWYGKHCKRVCFHDEYLPSFNLPN
ncbi:MAG: flavin-containing monooxygenase, partial [Actinomycetes bacterium]